MIVHLQVTESEARQLIAGVQDTNPELARVLRKNLDRQTGFAHPGQTRGLHLTPFGERVTDFGRQRESQ